MSFRGEPQGNVLCRRKVPWILSSSLDYSLLLPYISYVDWHVHLIRIYWFSIGFFFLFSFFPPKTHKQMGISWRLLPSILRHPPDPPLLFFFFLNKCIPTCQWWPYTWSNMQKGFGLNSNVFLFHPFPCVSFPVCVCFYVVVCAFMPLIPCIHCHENVPESWFYVRVFYGASWSGNGSALFSSSFVTSIVI